MSKLERLVARQLLCYLTKSQLLPELQSAYRAKHSTETAVLKVLSDILQALDTGALQLSPSSISLRPSIRSTMPCYCTASMSATEFATTH